MIASVAAHFTAIDWLVVFGYFALTTLIGARLAGRQATFRDFFLGGRKLPWYAVTGSMIATEISAVTFVSLPALVYQPGGNLTYLQLGLIGSLIARIIVGYVLVPAYYRREIYSPYDYMGNQLGASARTATSVLFAIGGVLGQSARVYLTAIVLDLLLRDSALGWLAAQTGISSITWSIWILGAVAVAWTLMGGITTVIWTDVMLFVVFMVGAVVALGFIICALDGGVGELVRAGSEVGKFHLVDFNPSPAAPYTIWTAVIAIPWLNVGAYGTNQLNAQRIFCCNGPREARKAVIASYAGMVVTVTVMLVGIGLFAYYSAHPLTGEAAALVEAKPDRIFPVFIIRELPPGLTGLLIAAVFAAAISSLDSILIALSQTTMSSFILPLRARWNSSHQADRSGSGSTRAEEPGPGEVGDARTAGDVRQSRWLVVFWGVAMCLLAQLAILISSRYNSVLELALAMDGYTAGALVATFALAFLPVSADARGVCWAAPVSVAIVFGINWHAPWAQLACVAFAAIMGVLWFGWGRRRSGRAGIRTTLVLVPALALPALCSAVYQLPPHGEWFTLEVAWPWYAPIGAITAFALGWAMSTSPVPAGVRLAGTASN